MMTDGQALVTVWAKRPESTATNLADGIDRLIAARLDAQKVKHDAEVQALLQDRQRLLDAGNAAAACPGCNEAMICPICVSAAHAKKLCTRH